MAAEVWNAGSYTAALLTRFLGVVGCLERPFHPCQLQSQLRSSLASSFEQPIFFWSKIRKRIWTRSFTAAVFIAPQVTSIQSTSHFLRRCKYFFQFRHPAMTVCNTDETARRNVWAVIGSLRWPLHMLSVLSSTWARCTCHVDLGPKAQQADNYMWLFVCYVVVKKYCRVKILHFKFLKKDLC
jgi:hypothetical protein